MACRSVCCSTLLLAFAMLAGAPSAMAAESRPEVWMMPPSIDNGRELQDLFEHPGEWQATRSKVEVLGYADHWLASQFSDAQLGAWLPQLDRWGLKLGLEVGAVKPWGPTGAQAFAADRKKWDRFQSLGGHIYAIAMDEPLAATRNNLHKPDAYAVEQTAQFIALVRQNYPGMKIGDIEPYPGISAGDLTGFIDALQARLRQMNVRGLDFFRLDVDWMHFHPGDSIGQDGWNGVHAIEAASHQRGLPFSLIYWAADFPSLNKKGEATDETWEQGIMQQGNKYAATGGMPDQYVIESWVDGPSQAVPETAPGTFSKSVLDFTRRFVQPAAR